MINSTCISVMTGILPFLLFYQLSVNFAVNFAVVIKVKLAYNNVNIIRGEVTPNIANMSGGIQCIILN